MTNTDKKCSCLTSCSCEAADTVATGIGPNATVELNTSGCVTATTMNKLMILDDDISIAGPCAPSKFGPITPEDIKKVKMRFISDQGKHAAPTISEISFKGAKTIVKFADGTMEKAVCKYGETFEKEIGVLICVAKRMTKGNILSIVQKAIRDQENRDAKAAMERQHKKEEAERLANKRAKLRAKKAKRRAAFELLVEQEKAKLKNQKTLNE